MFLRQQSMEKPMQLSRLTEGASLKNQLQAFGIEPLTPDEFMVHQWHLDAPLVQARLMAQVTEYKKSLSVHLALLRRMIPNFVALVQNSTALEGELGAANE